MTTQTTSRNTTGIVLIIVGLALFAMQFLRWLGPEVFLFGLSTAFLAGYLIWCIYGLLIPGGILLGVGLGFYKNEENKWRKGAELVEAKSILLTS